MVEYFLIGIRSLRTLKKHGLDWMDSFQKEVLLLTLGNSMLEFVKQK